MLKRSMVCFGLESRDSLLEEIRSSCAERGSMVVSESRVNWRQSQTFL